MQYLGPTVADVNVIFQSMPAPLRLLPMLWLVLSHPASAAGLGEITIRSRIGEPLQAEVLLADAADERFSSACFSLLQTPAGDLPSITDARIHVESRAGQTFLRIVGRQPLHEPLANLRLRAGCGFELQRDYVVMPTLPLATPQQPSPPAVRTISNLRESPPLVTAQARTKPRTDRNSLPTAPRNSAPAPKMPAPAEPPAAAPIPADPVRTPTEDRLVLDTAPFVDDPRLKSPEHQEMEARMLRMETSLRHLNQALDSIDAAMALNVEKQALRHELQLTQSIQPLPAPPATPPAKGWQRWIQLFLGMMLGGGLTALAVDWLDKRNPGHRRSIRLSV